MRKSNTIEGIIDKLEYHEAELCLAFKQLKSAKRISFDIFNSFENALDHRATALRSLKRLTTEK